MKKKHLYLLVVFGEVLFSLWLQLRAISAFETPAEGSLFVLTQAIPLFFVQIFTPALAAFGINFKERSVSSSWDLGVLENSAKLAAIVLLFSLVTSPIYILTLLKTEVSLGAIWAVYIVGFSTLGYLTTISSGLTLVLRNREEFYYVASVNMLSSVLAVGFLEVALSVDETFALSSFLALLLKSVTAVLLLSLRVRVWFNPFGHRTRGKRLPNFVGYSLKTSLGKFQIPADKAILAAVTPEALTCYAAGCTIVSSFVGVYERTANFWLASSEARFSSRFRYILSAWLFVGVVLSPIIGIAVVCNLGPSINGFVAGFIKPHLASVFFETMIFVFIFSIGAALSSSVSTALNLKGDAMHSARAHFASNFIVIVIKLVLYPSLSYSWLIFITALMHAIYCILVYVRRYWLYVG